MRDQQIIKSLLEADFYKFTMGCLVWKLHPDVRVRYKFRNRTRSVRMAEVISEGEFREQLDAMRQLRINKTEEHYLRGIDEYSDRMFPEGYLKFLLGLRLPPYELRVVDGQFELEFAGKWSEAIYWETLVLSLLNQMYYEALERRMTRFECDTIRAEAVRKLAEKIKILKSRASIMFCDFGNRRAWKREWEDYVVGVLSHELPTTQFLGTSNVYLAMKHGVTPMGTNAHELSMIYAALTQGRQDTDEAIRESQFQVLRDWWDTFGFGLSIVLPDTFGSDFWFQNMPHEVARDWKGLRQDSMDPFEFGEKQLALYKFYGIDAREKLLIPSDGLELSLILRLDEHFRGCIKVSYGWGTSLTNDTVVIPEIGYMPLSIVVKPSEAQGVSTVKLSDNLTKATGREEDIERMKRIFGYNSDRSVDCKY